MHRYYIVLENSAHCELDRKAVKDDDDIQPSLLEAVGTWVIYPGDTIRVVEE